MKTKKINHPTVHQKDTALDRIIKSSAIGLLITISIALALLLISSAIAIKMPDPLALVDPIGYFSLFATAFFGGFACSKLNKGSGVLVSVICGCIFVVFSMLCSFILPNSLSSGIHIWARLGIHILSLLCFPLGAIVDKKSSQKPHKRRRK